MSSLSKVVGWNFKGKSRFKSSRSSHRCSNANAKFQFLFWNTTGSFRFEACRQHILYFTIHKHSGSCLQIVDWRGRVKSGPFLCRKCKRGIKILMFLHRATNIEHHIKQNIYTGIEAISFIPPLYSIEKQLLKSDASSEITNFQKDLFFKEHSWRQRLYNFFFYIISHGVCDVLLPYLK